MKKVTLAKIESVNFYGQQKKETVQSLNEGCTATVMLNGNATEIGAGTYNF